MIHRQRDRGVPGQGLRDLGMYAATAAGPGDRVGLSGAAFFRFLARFVNLLLKPVCETLEAQFSQFLEIELTLARCFLGNSKKCRAGIQRPVVERHRRLA
jgi:hypothetical protein